MSRNSPIFAELTSVVPGQRQRVLCLAPPGELGPSARVCIEAVGSHGLVGFAPDGKAKVTIVGHKFGEVDLKSKIDELLQD